MIRNMKTRSVIVALFTLFANAAMAQQQIPALERVEPMNWWVGMKNPNLPVGDLLIACNSSLAELRKNGPHPRDVVAHKLAHHAPLGAKR